MCVKHRQSLHQELLSPVENILFILSQEFHLLTWQETVALQDKAAK
jgi:hypothetical protein